MALKISKTCNYGIKIRVGLKLIQKYFIGNYFIFGHNSKSQKIFLIQTLVGVGVNGVDLESYSKNRALLISAGFVLRHVSLLVPWYNHHRLTVHHCSTISIQYTIQHVIQSSY